MSVQPFYTATIYGVDCHFNLYINDIPLLKFNRGANVNTEMPINMLLQNKENQLTCDIFPLKGQDAISDTATVRITIIEGGIDSKRPTREVARFQSPSFSVSKENPPKKTYRLDGVFSAAILFASLLEQGALIFDNDKLRTELFELYREIAQLFKGKNVQAVLDIMALKIREYAAMNGKEISEVEKDYRRDYTDYVNDPTFDVWDFAPDKVILKLYNRNKLACFEVKNGNQPLCFINRLDHIAIYIPIYFFRNPASKKLEIIR